MLVAFTNDRGEFQVNNLAAGKYYVSLEGKNVAMQSGFGVRLPMPIGAIPRREEFEDIIPKHDASFTVDGTNTVEVEVRVPRGGAISGKVLKANGSPAANVPVTFLSRAGNLSGPATARFSAQTNKDGEYKIQNLPEGEYLVAAAIEDKSGTYDMLARVRGESQIVTYHPAAISMRDAIPVVVEPGRESGSVNVTLVARNSFGVSGTLMFQRDGTALANAMVVLRNKESEFSGPLAPGMGQRSTRTDGDGRWSFSNVAEGEYIVTALAPRTSPARAPGVEPDREQMFRESRQRFLVTQQEVSVRGAEVKGLSLVVSGPGTIVGRVEMDDNTPVPNNLVIFVEMVTKGSRPAPPMPVRVGADNTFVLDGIQGGDVFLGIALPPDAGAFIKSSSVNGENLNSAPINIVEGGQAGPVQVVLSRNIAKLSGRLTTGSVGQEIGDYVVVLVPVEAAKQRFRTSYLTTRPAADGSFSLSGAPGEYFVLVRKRDGLPPILTEDFIKAEAPAAERIILSAGDQRRDFRVP